MRPHFMLVRPTIVTAFRALALVGWRRKGTRKLAVRDQGEADTGLREQIESVFAPDFQDLFRRIRGAAWTLQ